MPAGAKISEGRGAIRLAAAVIVLAGLAAYAGSFTGALLYDDLASIADNPAIRHLAPWAQSTAAQAAGGLTTSGRPLLRFSLAVNYALGGSQIWGYHAANLAIHLLAGLCLFGVARRTLRRWGGTEATPAAWAIALLWTLHPLQTEAVSYLVQRAESLMGLLYLLTLYGFIRGVEAADSRRASGWLGVSWLACLLGMATKEVMVTAPLMVLLYDRTFAAGTFRSAWAGRKAYYAGLAATWLPLAAFVASTGGNRGGTAGFGVAVSAWAYALTQFQALARYLWLAVWPHPLVFEYGIFWVRGAGDLLPYAVPVLLLLGATIWALLRPAGRARAAGFLGAWFFGILAPSSLTPGTMQMIVEHRMYLPLAGVIAAVVLGARALLEKAGAPGPIRLLVLAGAAAAAGALTFQRNEIYRSAVAIWSDTVARRPDNALAVYNLGVAWDQEQQFSAAAGQFSRAIELRPDLAAPRYDLGFALIQMGRPAEAVDPYEAALRIDPHSAMAQEGLGLALAALGRLEEARAHYEEAIRLQPGYARAQDNLGNVLLRLRQLPEAAGHYAEAVRLDPQSVVARYNLANALLRLGRPAEAAAQYAAVLQLRPGDPAALAALERARQAAAAARFP
jgi:tetratricopeptide (TPR) repeat protein